ncbi:hypothetical protein I302_103074 [Kwoniella bestiolae CBS 10118]|uniref:Uncharacterized protein n=1 Tax=Kwoniella bestiolae CBS 10118 TaxID=1296100 RepID=A0A1B9GGR1_9TREE|nr:hypothetical protein I302_01773 [Kwoniella bestiolae CBS 10118]OCF30254.1 hypothetical protein I302_01773 [Kwoniella bestiolae CBS 10118]
MTTIPSDSDTTRTADHNTGDVSTDETNIYSNEIKYAAHELRRKAIDLLIRSDVMGARKHCNAIGGLRIFKEDREDRTKHDYDQDVHDYHCVRNPQASASLTNSEWEAYKTDKLEDLKKKDTDTGQLVQTCSDALGCSNGIIPTALSYLASGLGYLTGHSNKAYNHKGSPAAFEDYIACKDSDQLRDWQSDAATWGGNILVSTLSPEVISKLGPRTFQAALHNGMGDDQKSKIDSPTHA